MNRYKIERRGDPDKWGPYQIIDANLGSFKPIAVVDDGEIAQRIADLLNFNQHVDIKWIGGAYRLTAPDMRL